MASIKIHSLQRLRGFDGNIFSYDVEDTRLVIIMVFQLILFVYTLFMSNFASYSTRRGLASFSTKTSRTNKVSSDLYHFAPTLYGEAVLADNPTVRSL